MSRTRSKGPLGRLFSLIAGTLTAWVGDTENQNPRLVYEQAIEERKRQYRELKQAVAGILYMRNKLEAELSERRMELARLEEDIRHAVDGSSDEISLALIARKQNLLEQAEHAERELESICAEAEEAKLNLVRFREEIRGLVREKGHMLATLANAEARRRMTATLEGLSVDAEMKALEGVREHISRLSMEGSLDRELGDQALRTRVRAIRNEAREDAARRELVELKARLQPGLAG